ncbi:MAG: NTP transferase domain-containing protein [Actinomycetota bacterium]|nr:NTP transferase domain-containing protein [Actinomycetota bacterium]
MGTRLGRPFPKPLTRLADGRSILTQQLDNVDAAFGPAAKVQIVVGFKLELVMEAAPDAVFVYNESYDQTNTCKSLLKALRTSHDGGVLWMNGDVVFDPEVLRRLAPHLASDSSVIAVNTAAVAEEEVKYTVGSDGFVTALSKSVTDALGEAVGINFIASKDKAALIRRLDECAEQDYFERGIELAIAGDGVAVTPVDISDLFAVEVDFEEDLTRANAVRHTVG